jgi:hypothetical protein
MDNGQSVTLGATLVSPQVNKLSNAVLAELLLDDLSQAGMEMPKLI